MERRPFGRTGLTVSVLGLGAGSILQQAPREGDRERLALDFCEQVEGGDELSCGQLAHRTVRFTMA
jgi:hypothetical protein